MDSNGKASLVEHVSNCPAVGLVAPAEAGNLSFDTETQLKSQMGFTAEPVPSRSVEIADYIERLGKLYNHCLTTANNIPSAATLDAPEVKDVATTFIQTVKHFQL